MADHSEPTIEVTPNTSPPTEARDTDRSPPDTSSGSAASRLPRKRIIFLVLLLLAIAIATPYGWDLWQYYQNHESTDDAYVVGDIVPMSPMVTGTILSVHVEDHQRVETGQLLVRLDPREFEAKVQQAQAFVKVAEARLRQAELEVVQAQDSTSSDTARTSASLRAAHSVFRETQHQIDESRAVLRALETAVTVAQAEVDAQDARLSLARMAFERARQLMTDGVVSQQQFDEAQNAVQTTQAERRVAAQKLAQTQREVERARADLRTKQQSMERVQAMEAEAQAVVAGSQANEQNVDIKQAEVAVMQAMVQQRQADLDYAKLQLDYTSLRAPAAGVIAKNNAEVGQVVQAGRPLMAIVPLQDVWVEANFKETQLRLMRPGQKAILEVDAYPGQVFEGSLQSISPGTGSVFSLLPPENATGNFVKIVQRVPVKIVLDAASNNGFVLRPGMSVIATIALKE
jgi:membrane fusion protein (multidrug efflux system)